MQKREKIYLLVCVSLPLFFTACERAFDPLSGGDEQVVRLILDGVDIRNSKSAPLYIQEAKKAIIILADNSANHVADGAPYVFDSADVDEPNAAIFSTADLTIYGNGSLTVERNYSDAIASKDGLILAGGSDDVTGVADSLGKNALAHGGHRFTADGSIDVTAIDDGIRGKDYCVIRDATITVRAGPMIEAPSATSTQNSVIIFIPATLSAASLLHIEDSGGDDVVTFKPVRNVFYVVFSSPKLLNGVTYSIYTGGSSTGTSTDGLYSGGDFSGGTLKKNFTVTSKVTQVSI